MSGGLIIASGGLSETGIGSNVDLLSRGSTMSIRGSDNLIGVSSLDSEGGIWQWLCWLRRRWRAELPRQTPRSSQHHHCHIPPSDSKEDTPIKFSDPLMLIVDPMLSNSTLLPMPVSYDPPDAIINPPAMSEPDVERPRQRPRRRPRRCPAYAYVPPM